MWMLEQVSNKKYNVYDSIQSLVNNSLLCLGKDIVCYVKTGSEFVEICKISSPPHEDFEVLLCIIKKLLKKFDYSCVIEGIRLYKEVYDYYSKEVESLLNVLEKMKTKEEIESFIKLL
jgi:hypothetical protein